MSRAPCVCFPFPCEAFGDDDGADDGAAGAAAGAGAGAATKGFFKLYQHDPSLDLGLIPIFCFRCSIRTD